MTIIGMNFLLFLVASGYLAGRGYSGGSHHRDGSTRRQPGGSVSALALDVLFPRRLRRGLIEVLK
jgi:hypothetical protein